MNLTYATHGNSHKNVAFDVKLLLYTIQHGWGKQIPDSRSL